MSAVLSLSRRSVFTMVRQPVMVFPSVFFPLLFAALNAANFERTTTLPGFPPVDSFLDFLLVGTIIQGVLFGSTSGGVDIATDIENGFFDRLLASPAARTSLLVSRLAGAAALGAFLASFFTAVLVPFGATVKGGIPAVLAIVLTSAVFAVGIGGFAVAIGLRTGSSEAVQAFFPLFFIVMFTSSGFFPRQLMSGWFKAVATGNPLSWMIDDLRHLTIQGFAIADAARAFAVAAALAVVSVVVAWRALRWKASR